MFVPSKFVFMKKNDTFSSDILSCISVSDLHVVDEESQS